MSMEKYRKLVDRVAEMGSAAVAFSGGTDSTLLLKAASEALGEKALALTVTTPYTLSREITLAKEFAAAVNIPFHLIEMAIHDELLSNPSDRCYICKKNIFTELKRTAEAKGILCLTDGTNSDDLKTHRPGIRALRELGVRSPLAELGITKADIRKLSIQLDLPTAGRASYACLMTRFPHGTKITGELLEMTGKCEDILYHLGFDGARVRVHGDLARIELPRDRIKDLTPRLWEDTNRFFKAAGFRYVCFDCGGYKTGAMDYIRKTEPHSK